MTIPRHIAKLLVDGYFVAVLVLSTGAFVSLFVNFQNAASYAEGSPIFKVAWALVYIISALRLFGHRQAAGILLGANKLLVALVLMALASLLWSIDRPATLHLAGTLALTTLFALDFALTFTVKRQLQLICTALAFTMISSVIAEVLLPGVIPGRDLEGAAWHGVFAFKNDFGRVICLTTVACLALTRRSLRLRLFIFASGIALTVLSRSASSVGYTVLMTGVLMFWPVLKWRPRPRAFAIMTLCVVTFSVGFYVSQNFAKVLAMADKDPHMTGRVDLWQLSLEDVAQKPVLGYGYSAFWGYDSQPARRIREAVNWDEAPHAHNGYIDLALNIGLVGVALYFLVFFTMMKNSYAFFREGTEHYRKWPLTYLIFALIYQCTESSVIGGNSVLWILFASIAFSVSLRMEEAAVAVQTPQLVTTAA